MGNRIASLACGLAVLAGVSCNSSSINGKNEGSLGAGAPCTASAQCASGDCGGGNCCATACVTGDACGSTGCDTKGACIYPSAGTSCPGMFCRDGTVGPMACNGMGICQPASDGTACAGNRGCTVDGGCRTSCASAADCASGFVCNVGACVSPIAVGSCSEDDDCTSGICGISGTGNCCSKSCATTNATCASMGCDESGACIYPDQTVLCGPGESCTGSTRTNASRCDGAGNCGATMTDCSPFACGASGCDTTCTSTADCATGALCDVANMTCCGGLADAGALAVDSVLGDDAVACCGYGGAAPCRTLSHALSLVGSGLVSDVVIHATVGGAAGDWAPKDEVYPIELGWGAELSAPGIFFAGSGNSPVQAIFELASDAGAEGASIVGTSDNPVTIGMDRDGGQTVATMAISDGQGSTLYLANANLNGSPAGAAIDANSSTLVLGQDRSGAVIGRVQIGNDLANPLPIGGTGIECDTCTLSDVPMKGSSVVIFGQVSADIDSRFGSVISLMSAPVLGIAPSALGFNTCPSKPDQTGLHITGTMTLSLDGATIQCMSNWGIAVDDDGAGGMPTVTLNKTTIQNTQYGLVDQAGSVMVSNSAIRYNTLGVSQGGETFQNGIVDLSGGEVGGRNTVACNSNVESGSNYPGVSVFNGWNNTLNASNVDWDTAGPDQFSCDENLANCTCQIKACSVAPGADGMDVVSSSTGAVLATGSGLSTLDCKATPGN